MCLVRECRKIKIAVLSRFVLKHLRFDIFKIAKSYNVQICIYKVQVLEKLLDFNLNSNIKNKKF